MLVVFTARHAPLANEPVAPDTPLATRLEAIETDMGPGGVTITLAGDGRLQPSSVHEADEWPPRVVIDFPDVQSGVPGRLPVELGPVRQIRVARHSDRPLVTRVVFDLEEPAAYRLEQGDPPRSALKVVFPDDVPAPLGFAEQAGDQPVSRHDPAPDPIAALAPLSAPPVDAESQDDAIAELLAELAVMRPTAVAPSALELARATDAADASAGFEPDVTETPLAAAVTPLRVPPAITEIIAPVWQPESPPPVLTERQDQPSVVSITAPRAGSPAVVAERSTPAVPTLSVETPVASQVPPGARLTSPRRFTEVVPTTRYIRRRSVTSAPRAQVGQQRRLGGAREYTGNPVSMDFQNADLRSVLRTFVEISGLNVVIDPAVQGSVDVALVDVPWDQALDIILRSNQLGYDIDGTVVRIAPLATLADEEEQRRVLAEQQALAGELVVLTRTLSYARASDLGDLVTTAVLSSRGQVQADVRTNTLIITDLEDRLSAAQELLDTLDRPEPQVEIEARIVQASQDYLRELGVEWGITGRVSQEIGNVTPLTFPNRGGLSGRQGGQQGPEADEVDERALAIENAGTAVNLRSPSATSALGLTLAAVDGSLNLDVILSAAENDGQVRILSNPRVTTQNNVQATIIQGDQIPIQTVANNTVTVTFKDAALRLAVTPQITAADTVIMQIEIDNDFADFSREVNGVPPIVTQSATTTVQVANGETTVIGGIYESEQTQQARRVPGLSRIPLLGWLFKSESDRRRTDELLIFLTPHIVR